MSQKLIVEEEEAVFKPLGFVGESADCAEQASAKDIANYQYKDNFAFKLAGRTLAKHSP